MFSAKTQNATLILNAKCQVDKLIQMFAVCSVQAKDLLTRML